MPHHQQLGKQGEALAATYLEQRGFIILHRNWRHSYYEIDIIASRENKLHFVEVKTRSNHKFGLPEESVTTKKLEKLMEAGAAFLDLYTNWKLIEYDILSITIRRGEPIAYFFIQDIYL